MSKKQNNTEGRINVIPEVVHELIKLYSVADVTVYFALRFVTSTELAMNIRKKAIELMDDVQKKNKKLIQRDSL